MSEDTARAVGAASPLTMQISDKECQIRPLTVRELTEVERDCLERYKHQVLKTYSDNAEFLPEKERVKVIRDKMDEVSLWDISDLPKKFAYDHRSVELTDRMRGWLEEKYDLGGEEDLQNGRAELRYKLLTAASLDSGTLSEDECKQLCGKVPYKGAVGYVHWWITGCYDGMVSFVWASFKPYGVSRDAVAGMPIEDLIRASRELENVTKPSVGNG